MKINRRSSKYWQDRFKDLEKISNAEMEVYNNRLKRLFFHAERNIEEKTTYWYRKFADNNGIVDMSDARMLLDKGEFEEFQWTVEEYIKKAKENKLDGRWIQELENASARVHVKRNEALQVELRQEVELLYAQHHKETTELLTSTFAKNFYRTAFEVQKATGVGFKLHGVDRRAINLVLNKPWTTDGVEFSSRIWTNRNRLVNELIEELGQIFATGDGLDSAINRIGKKFDVPRRNASALIRTEHANISSQSREMSLRSLGADKFTYIATLDSRTSDICQDMDLKEFPISQFKVGVTAPPLHVNCRSTTAPVIDRSYGERIAKNKDGKNIFVPADTSYKDWLENYQNVNDDIKQISL